MKEFSRTPASNLTLSEFSSAKFEQSCPPPAFLKAEIKREREIALEKETAQDLVCNYLDYLSNLISRRKTINISISEM